MKAPLLDRDDKRASLSTSGPKSFLTSPELSVDSYSIVTSDEDLLIWVCFQIPRCCGHPRDKTLPWEARSERCDDHVDLAAISHFVRDQYLGLVV
jgi:hypothetical protein